MPADRNKEKADVFDRAGMLERLMDDEELARKLIAAFLKDIPQRFDTLRECLEEGNVKGVERMTHLIKGASASVGGNALTAVAYMMEKASRAGNLDGIKEGVGKLESEFGKLKQAMEEEM